MKSKKETCKKVVKANTTEEENTKYWYLMVGSVAASQSEGISCICDIAEEDTFTAQFESEEDRAKTEKEIMEQFDNRYTKIHFAYGQNFEPNGK